MIDVPIQRLSEITNYKINKYTVDQLIENLSLLAEHDAQIREYLVFLEQATELSPTSLKYIRDGYLNSKANPKR